MKNLSFYILIMLLIQTKCTFVSSSSSLDTFKIQYTDKEYTSQVGNVTITPVDASNTSPKNTVPLVQKRNHELAFDLLSPDYQYLKMKIFHCDWSSSSSIFPSSKLLICSAKI